MDLLVYVEDRRKNWLWSGFQNPLRKQLLPHTLNALATAYAIGTTYHHFPYESARTASYIRVE